MPDISSHRNQARQRRGIALIGAALALMTFTPASQAGDVFKSECHETHSVAFNDDGTQLAYSGGKSIHIIETRSRKPVRSLKDLPGDANTIVWVGDRIAATGGKYVGIWNATDGSVVKIHKTKAYTYNLVACRETGVIYAGQGAVGGWSLETGEVAMPEITLKEVESIAVDPKGKRLYVSEKWGSSIKVFDAKSGKPSGEIKTVSRARQMIFLPNGKSMIVVRFGKPVVEMSARGKVLRELKPQTSFGKLSTSRDGRYLLMPTWSTERKKEEVIVLDLKRRGKIKKVYKVVDGGIYDARLSPDDKVLVAAPKDENLHFFKFKG